MDDVDDSFSPTILSGAGPGAIWFSRQSGTRILSAIDAARLCASLDALNPRSWIAALRFGFAALRAAKIHADCIE